MANNFFLGALPSYDQGYVETSASDAAPSPMYQQYTPPVDQPSGGTPVPSQAPTDKPIDVGGGTQQQESPNVPKNEEEGKEGDDNAGGFKLSAPILILGAAAIYFFFFRKKQ